MERSLKLESEPPLSDTFEQRLSSGYLLLSAKLQEAANFVLANPVDVASRSLRSVSRDAGLAPATFSRMSRALGYANYEVLRDAMRTTISKPKTSFSEQVGRLQEEHDAGQHDFLANHFISCTANLQTLENSIDRNSLERTVELLHKARKVVVLGALGSTGIAEYTNYMANFISDKWNLAGRMGASIASSLVGITSEDVLIIVTKPPFAKQSIAAAQEARAGGANVVVVTDTHSCPALKFANEYFIVPTKSANFFSSYAATLVLMETIIGMLASRSGADAHDRITKVEDTTTRLGEVWDG